MRPIVFVALVTGALAAGGGGWGYDDHNGQHTWGAACQSGLKQSPIDIRPTDVDYALLHRLQFRHYDHSGTVNVVNNGHTIVVSGFADWGSKQPYITGGGLKHDKYLLAQFHLHWAQHDHLGSEHKIGGLHYPAELHLVHVRSDLTLDKALNQPDGLAVVGVFLLVGHDGGPMGTLANTLELFNGNGNQSTVTGFRGRHVLPANTDSFYRYEGSLTTPECQEAVIWTLLAEPISITRAQLKSLRSVQSVDQSPNFRHTQPLNGRRVQFRPAQFNQQVLCHSSASYIMSLIPVFSLIYHLLL